MKIKILLVPLLLLLAGVAIAQVPLATGVQAGAPPDSGTEIVNSSGEAAYAGPCPPSGTHHYRFTVYELSDRADVTADSSTEDALTAIDAVASGRCQQRRPRSGRSQCRCRRRRQPARTSV